MKIENENNFKKRIKRLSKSYIKCIIKKRYRESKLIFSNYEKLLCEFEFVRVKKNIFK